MLEATLFNQVGDLGARYPELLADGEGGKIALHALAGGLAAEATGGDFSTGAAAAGANEALVEQLDTLVANDPQLLVAASKLTGLMAAGLVDGDVAQGAEIAGNATTYNYLTHRQVAKYVEEAKDCEARGDCDQVQEKYRQLSLDQQDELIEACAGDRQGCAARYQPLVEDSQRFREELDKLGGSDLPLQISLDAGPLLGQYMEAESVVSQEGFAQSLKDRYGLDDEEASIISAAAMATMGGIARRGGNNAKSPNAQDALRAKISGLQKAQETAVVAKDLPDGRVRYYTQEVPARTDGPTRGASFVTEYNPQTGKTRQWMESYDHSGKVIRVHPKSINGQPVSAQHYPPTRAELESWK
ncbi:VENN motif pre-toxin domain-containing protein [uncultured Salinicola sp.]|uniref:VENN motif pre-toxin domain-containing protein n=1 Tax=uncultured Salinicola sp. TaxID=1193542 RepID=UPI00263893AA|nr:VENN motif pre-toxin domain-containing protein [uncultured Salinicola sp.]